MTLRFPAKREAVFIAAELQQVAAGEAVLAEHASW